MYEHVTQLFKITFITQEKNVKKKKKLSELQKKKKYLFQKSIGVYLHTRTLLAATELNFKKKRKKTFFALSRD